MLGVGRSVTGRSGIARDPLTAILDEQEWNENEAPFCQFGHDREVREDHRSVGSIQPNADGKVHIKDECLYEGVHRFDRPLGLTNDVDLAVMSAEHRVDEHGL
jgi:hypothetical protein